MDKYTKLYESGLAYIPSHKVKLLNNELVGEPITRLAQYESFGLEPATKVEYPKNGSRGWTYNNCCNLFGHEDCLKSVRRNLKGGAEC